MSSNTSGGSSKDCAEEDFNWVDNNDFSIDYKKEYLEYPLADWKKIVSPKIQDDDYTIIEEGKYYQEIINKILKENIFDGFTFCKEKDGRIKVKNGEYSSQFQISPDFIVKKIRKEDFIEFLEKRKYMMRTYFKIDESVKYINIIGEIKLSHKQLIKKQRQRQSYLNFIEEENRNDEKFLLMYVYDQSFSLYKEDLCKLKTEEPIIYCYIPKLYKKTCYLKYNEIVDKYDTTKRKINMNEEIHKRTKREIEDENYILRKRLELSEKKNNIFLIIIISAAIIIISQILERLRKK